MKFFQVVVNMDELKTIFHSRQHEVTTRWRDGKHYADKKFLFSNKKLKKIIETQPQGTDVYITKYPKDGLESAVLYYYHNFKKSKKPK